MMTQAFYTGVSGLRTHQYAIDVVSNNMANISTVGFRASDYEFASMYEEKLSATSAASVDSIGIGSRFQASTIRTSQGVLQLTDRSTDLAIVGDGWFGLGENDKVVYTRDGSFTFDANNDLVSVDGFHVLGTLGNNISKDNILTKQIDEITLGSVTTQEKLRFPKFLSYPAEATSNTQFFGNIGTEDELRTIGVGVVDAQNNNNHLKLSFTKKEVQIIPGSQWNVVATTETLDGKTIYDTKNGEVFFDENGGLLSNTLTTIDNNGSLVNIDLGSAFGGVVSTNNKEITASSLANGAVGGDLVGYSINKNAEVIATFSNGVQSSVGKIAVYHFQNEQGLSRLNGSKFEESANSGDALFFTDSNGKNILGTDITNFKLEGANIDLSYGLTELIILQRAYDASSKLVSTADQMMQKALNMDA